jgi:hypothetical protein
MDGRENILGWNEEVNKALVSGLKVRVRPVDVADECRFTAFA